MFSFLILPFVLTYNVWAATPATDFKKAVQLFTQNSASLLAQEAVVEATEEYKKSKFFHWTPTARFNLYKPIPGAQTGALTGMSGELSLSLWKFGSGYKGYQAASAKLRAENARLGLVKQDFETFISNVLFQLIQQNKIIDIQKRHLGLREESFLVARERFKQGQLASQELEKVKIELETSKISLSEAELKKIDLQNSLKALVDSDISLTEWPFTTELNQQRKFKYREIKDFFKVKAHFADKEYSTFRVSEILRESYLPSLNVSAQWVQPDLGPIKHGEWMAYFGISIPLWDQLSGSALAAQEAASARNSELNYLQSLRETKAQLTTLEERLELTKSNVQAAIRAAGKLQELRNDSLKRFRLGRSSVNDLLIDENRFLEAESALLNSMLAYHLLLVENCHAADESLLNCY